MGRPMAPLPQSVAASPRFLAQLSEARRLRAELPRSSSPLCDELTLDGPQWREATDQLATALASALGMEDRPLERLHGALEQFSARDDAHKRVMAAKRALLLPLASDSPAASAFVEAYDCFVCSVVAPHVAEALRTSEVSQGRSPSHLGSLYYAAFPTLRVQTPSLSRATIRPHFDGMYDLPEGSINFWMPLSQVSEPSALWIESSPPVEAQHTRLPREDHFHPLCLPTRFDGRSKIHFTIPNRSRRTRVSLDFRVVPGHNFDESARLSRLGYYSRADALPSDALELDGAAAAPSATFIKAASGRVSKLHGLPHSVAPVEM